MQLSRNQLCEIAMSLSNFPMITAAVICILSHGICKYFAGIREDLLFTLSNPLLIRISKCDPCEF